MANPLGSPSSGWAWPNDAPQLVVLKYALRRQSAWRLAAESPSLIPLSSMPAKIRPIGSLKSYTAGQPEVPVEAGRTVRETLVALGIPSEVVAGVFLNDVLLSKDYVVKEGDILKLIAVIGGGVR